MSYILEALKKAQAERQLGSSPTLHAPTLQANEADSGASRFSKPLLAAVMGMAAVIAVLLVLVLRPDASPAPVAQQVAPAVVAPVAAATPVAAPAAPTPLPAPEADLPPSVANLARASANEAPPQPVAATPAPTPAPAAKPGAADEVVTNLRELPEPIQRAVPPVTMGGYIYSKNPADRLLLIDKVLRHEGEEVAPGLVLEKLQPHQAVFAFKGYRYRVPY